MLFSASGSVCVVLWVTLDAIFREAYEAVLIRFLMVFLVICIVILSIVLIQFFMVSSFVWLAVAFMYSPLMDFNLF